MKYNDSTNIHLSVVDEAFDRKRFRRFLMNRSTEITDALRFENGCVDKIRWKDRHLYEQNEVRLDRFFIFMIIKVNIFYWTMKPNMVINKESQKCVWFNFSEFFTQLNL